MSKKKITPKTPRPSAWQIEKMIRDAKEKATEQAVSLALVLMFSVLLDKYNAEEYIEDIWKDWNKLAEEVKEGRVNLSDLRDVLRKEYQIGI